MFFTVKKDEVGAVNLFKKNCTYHGLDVHLSLNALNALKAVVDATARNEEIVIGERDTHTLERRGLIRVTPDTSVVLTQLGLLVVALAEAAALITIKHSREKIDGQIK